jgi:hypothetical protein
MIHQPTFNSIITMCIVINTLVLAVEHEGQVRSRAGPSSMVVSRTSCPLRAAVEEILCKH